MLRTAIADLDRDALRHNLERARAAAPHTSVFATIKSAGYGHGLTFAAEAFADRCEGFGVACTGEGIALREAGYRGHRICVFNGPAEADELAACAEHGLEPLIHQAWHLDAIGRLNADAGLRVWLKIDSGMGRVGVPPDTATVWHDWLRRCPAVAEPVGFMTHMSCADDRGDDYTHTQWETFTDACGDRPGERSAANSACVLGWADTHADWIRPGIMLYGCSPFVEGAESALDLRPAMTLRTRLIAINRLRAGAPIGYGRSYHCPEDMPVGVAAIGYGDGYPRHAPNGTPVLVGGCRVPMVGRVSMDKITVDLRTAPDAAVGDEVVLWGRGLPIEEIAEASGTIGYELMCGIHGRVETRLV
jgi:alanine racemase